MENIHKQSAKLFRKCLKKGCQLFGVAIKVLMSAGQDFEKGLNDVNIFSIDY